ncbi:MAG: hypothetical protein PVF57_11605 [Pseudomonadales bacterium]|jgi:hypothetical protein
MQLKTSLIKSIRSPRLPRWLAAAGIGACLMVPFNANAAYQDNGAVEVLASAAIAYAVIDAAGGFDKHGRKVVHYDHRYGHRYDHRYDRYRWHRQHDRRYWYGHNHYRDDRHHRKDKHRHDRRDWGHDRGHNGRGHDHHGSGKDQDRRHRAFH